MIPMQKRANRRPLKALHADKSFRFAISAARDRESDERTKASGDTFDFALLVAEEVRCQLLESGIARKPGGPRV